MPINEAKTGALIADELWFAEDIEIPDSRPGSIEKHIQFSLDIASVIEFTLNQSQKASATITCLGVQGRNKASATITCASVVGLNAATGTLTLVSAIAGDEAVVNGLTYTAVSGVKSDNTEFSIDTSDTAAALDLADSISNDTRTGVTVPSVDQTATSSLGVVTITAGTRGIIGNGIDISSPDATITASGANLTGGTEGDTVTVNGLTYLAVTGTKADDTEFSVDTGDNETATDLADSIDDDVRVGTDVPDQDVVSNASTDTVTITAVNAGVEPNQIQVKSSNGTRLAVSKDHLNGGAVGDTVTVNGLVYTAVVGTKADDTEFSVDTDNDACATDLADSIDDDVRTPITVPGQDVESPALAANILIVRSKNAVAAANDIDVSSSAPTRLVVSRSKLQGGHAGTAKFETVEEGKVFQADAGYDIFINMKHGDTLNLRAKTAQTTGLNHGIISG